VPTILLFGASQPGASYTIIASQGRAAKDELVHPYRALTAGRGFDVKARLSQSALDDYPGAPQQRRGEAGRPLPRGEAMEKSGAGAAGRSKSGFM
jgi:hypothetical protein